MLDGFIVLGLLAVPLLIPLGAFLLEYLATYGLQDSGFARHRRLFRIVGLSAAGVGALALLITSLGLAEIPV